MRREQARFQGLMGQLMHPGGVVPISQWTLILKERIHASIRVMNLLSCNTSVTTTPDTTTVQAFRR
jgi:hypothetical protein